MRNSDTQVRASVPHAVRKEIFRLVGARPGRYLLEAAITWALIVGSTSLALLIDNFFVTVLTIIFIATRQNVLGLLVHEQTHQLGFRNRFGDCVANAVAGYPLVFIALTVENYSKVHLSHHSHYFSRKDPDFVRKNGVDWIFPMKKARLLALFLKDISGLTMLKNIKGKIGQIENRTATRSNPTPISVTITYFVAVAGLLSYFDLWWVVLIFWILPLVTVVQVLVRWGALCEHTYGIERAQVEDTSPIIILSCWEKLLVPNLNFTFHPYHHYFANVSFSELPKVHEIFVREGLVRKETIFNGYLEYARFLLRGPRDQPSNGFAPSKTERRAH